MTIAPKLSRYLAEQGADFELIAHDPTRTAIETARVCQVPAGQMAKAVLIDTEEDYLLAVLPANRRVELAEVRSELGLRSHLAVEKELTFLFDDCEFGAVPPIGASYGVTTIVDECLDSEPDVYFEGGDHASLIHMSGAEFARLTRQARRGQISQQRTTMN